MGGERHPDGASTYRASEAQMQSYVDARNSLAGFPAPLLVDGARTTDRLFVAAFDGTGNSRTGDPLANHTNVAHLYAQILRHAENEEYRQGYSAIVSGYVEGVGTQGGLGGIRDQMSGHTYASRLEDMYLQFTTQAARWIQQNPDADIRVAAIGFSRGAEQAAGFTRMVEERGIRDPGGVVIHRGRGGLIDRVDYQGAPLREPGTVVQAAGLFDPVGTGTPRDHDRRLAASVVSGFQITAADERRNLFQGTRVLDPGPTADGRFLNVTVAGAHSNIGGSYSLDGLSVRSGNLMADYLNALSDRPYLDKRPEPDDPARNVIHRSEDHQVFYRTSIYDHAGTRAHKELLAPEALCRIDCRDAEPRNEAMAAALSWRPVQIGPVPAAPDNARAEASPQAVNPMVQRLLEAARDGDGADVSRLLREQVQSDDGQAWLRHGQAQLQESMAREAAMSLAPAPASQPTPHDLVR